MALKIVEGDLFANVKPPALIVHGCNAQGKMESGFAGKLRNKFPDAYKIYKTAEEAHGLMLGDINGYTDTDGHIIVNAITQEFYGNDKSIVYVDYEAVEKALSTVARFAAQLPGGIPIHLPFIGGGLANGNRDKLLEIFERVFKDSDATLWLQ
jgi:O-acetyl-ADP-ribose deacetylase (regulator of RNase III)